MHQQRTFTRIVASIMAVFAFASGACAQRATNDSRADDASERYAAEQRNDARAQYNLGVRYANGDGVAQDDAQALAWYRRAAAQGYASAQYNLGFFYLQGRGVARSDRTAVDWFRRAAELGHAEAQGMLGFLYERGRGVPVDAAAAAMWYRRAADQDEPKSAEALDRLQPGWRDRTPVLAPASDEVVPPPSTSSAPEGTAASPSAAPTSATSRYAWVDATAAAELADHQGRLLVKGDPVTVNVGGKKAVGIRITSIDEYSPLVFTSVQPGDILAAINDTVFDSAEALSRYVASLRIPQVAVRIEYWSASAQSTRTETIPSMEPSPRLAEVRAKLMGGVGTLVPDAYACSHLSAAEYEEYQARTRIYQGRPAEVSVKREKITNEYIEFLSTLNARIRDHAENHPCIRRDLDPAVRKRVEERVAFMSRCSSLSILEVVAARQVGGNAMQRWAGENERKSEEVLTAAVKELQNAGMDAVAWIRSIKAERKDSSGIWAFDLMPTKAERDRTKLECIRQGLMIDIETRMIR